jgi:DNA-binding response OmpR family regulator
MKKILVVDDNQEILELIELILRLEGYQVSGLMDASHFNQRITEFKPDLILLDVMLGALDGRDLCNLLKADQLTLRYPNDFIAKPFDISNLINKVSAQLAA